MNKEEYAKLHYLLAKMKYEEYKSLISENLSPKTKQNIKEMISCIEKIEKICIIEE